MRVGDSDSGLKRVSEYSMGNQKLEYCDTELTETHWLRFCSNLFILLLSMCCLYSCFSGLQLGIDIPSVSKC